MGIVKKIWGCGSLKFCLVVLLRKNEAYGKVELGKLDYDTTG